VTVSQIVLSERCPHNGQHPVLFTFWDQVNSDLHPTQNHVRAHLLMPITPTKVSILGVPSLVP
jgi:hypothetical protein